MTGTAAGKLSAVNSNGGPPTEQTPASFDPKTGEPIYPLDALGDMWTAEILSIDRVNRLRPHRWIRARHRDTGDVVEFGPISSAEFDSRPIMRRLLYEALGGDPGPLLSDPEHREALHMVALAERFRDDGHSDDAMWTERIHEGIRQSGDPKDLHDPDAKKRHLDHNTYWCFADTDGQAWVYAPDLAQHLRTMKIAPGIKDREVCTAITHIGFQKEAQNWRDPKGKERTRNYWRSPPGFTDPPAADEGS